jgi:hypothetical protein
MRGKSKRVVSWSNPSAKAPPILNPFSKGRLNQRSGQKFENYVKLAAMRESLMLISNGLKAKRYADKVVATKSNLDFIVLGDARMQEVAFLDSKCFSGKRFGRSAIDARQLALAHQYYVRGFVASGFLVLLREIDHVGFYSAELLKSGKARQGFGPEDGVSLGTMREFSLREIWQETRQATTT